MSAGESIERRPPAPAWKLWANPIIRRYAKSRLRPQGFGLWLLIVTLIAGFMFFAIRATALYQTKMDPVDAWRTPLIPLLVLQGVILFLLGTGQVAGGMTAESDEGVLDYQRLAPMTPLAKVLGYLFGLPIREYALMLATAPFTLWCLWRGQVPIWFSFQLYAVFFSSTIVYHLTGLVAGTVVKNKRWAFLVSMMVVFFLYTVMPLVANFGLVYFKYLTVMPVVEESMPHLLPRTVGAGMQTLQNLAPTAKFFDLDLPQSAFTLLSQGVLSLTGVVMLWRRWRRSESHLLGKAWAVGFFGWLQLMLLGNALPLLETGQLFPSRAFNNRAGRFGNRNWSPDVEEAMVMVGVYGLVTLLFLWILTAMITPVRDGQLRGWRRARKLGQSRLAPLSDPATAFWSVALMIGIGAFGWIVFAHQIMGSRWFPGWDTSPAMPIAFVLVLFGSGFGLHALLESRGPRTVGLVAVLVGFVPLGLGTIAVATGKQLSSLAVWLLGISPLMSSPFAAGTTLPQGDMPLEITRPLASAFWFWQGVFALVAVWLIGKLIVSRREIAKLSAAGDKVVLPEEG